MAYKVFFCAVPENRQSSTTWAQNHRFFRGFSGPRPRPAPRLACPGRGGTGRRAGSRPGPAGDAAGRLRSRLRQGRPRGLPGIDLCGRRGRSAAGDRPERRRQVLSASPGRGLGATAARTAGMRGRRCGTDHRRAGALSRPSGRAQARRCRSTRTSASGRIFSVAAQRSARRPWPPSASTGSPTCPRSISPPGSGGASRLRA